MTNARLTADDLERVLADIRRNAAEDSGPRLDAEIALRAHIVAVEVSEARLRAQRGALLTLTRMLDEHPEGYDGPCECRTCASYADSEGESDD